MNDYSEIKGTGRYRVVLETDGRFYVEQLYTIYPKRTFFDFLHPSKEVITKNEWFPLNRSGYYKGMFTIPAEYISENQAIKACDRFKEGDKVVYDTK